MKLPKVITSSVIRSAHKGESHGGVYIVDLETSIFVQVIDWDDNSINWEGRGADRGLRGIAFYDDRVYLAASDEVFVYTKDFELIRTHRNKYLKHCHEIYVSADTLFLTSTGFDAVLEFDLVSQSFVKGYHLRYNAYQLWIKNLSRRLLGQTCKLIPEMMIFDPNMADGPSPRDTFHINNVRFCNGRLYVSGAKLDSLLYIQDNKVFSYAEIPYSTHNVRPFKKGVLLNHSAADQVAYMNIKGGFEEVFTIPRYNENKLLNSNLSKDHARQAFGRGLCLMENGLIIGGSSPATISVYRFGNPTPIRSVNITMDIRNSIHGLEIWP
jgi:hypothetical protein